MGYCDDHVRTSKAKMSKCATLVLACACGGQLQLQEERALPIVPCLQFSSQNRKISSRPLVSQASEPLCSTGNPITSVCKFCLTHAHSRVPSKFLTNLKAKTTKYADSNEEDGRCCSPSSDERLPPAECDKYQSKARPEGRPRVRSFRLQFKLA